MNKFSNKIEPKITVTFHKKDGDRQIRPSIRKMKILLNSSRESLFKNSAFITFRVIYGRKLSGRGKVELFDNYITTNTLADLQLAFEAFLDKDIWITRLQVANCL